MVIQGDFNDYKPDLQANFMMLQKKNQSRIKNIPVDSLDVKEDTGST